MRGRRPSDPHVRFWRWVHPQPTEHGCWQWIGHKLKGYGKFQIGPSSLLAYRWLYKEIHGSLTPGLELDHLCRNRACVNPEHLEPVSHLENIRRGKWATATHCPNGHEYTPESTAVGKRGTRLCRPCSRVRYQKHYWRYLAASVQTKEA